MKTSICRFLMFGAALATLALNSACSQQNSGAQTQAVPAAAPKAPVVSATPAVPEPVASSEPMAVAEIPAVAAAMPSNIPPTSPLAQVARLAQAGVDESIIMVYITNSSRTFNLDSDKIIYLTDLGLPTDVVTAMMERDQFLQQQFAAAQAEQQAQQVQQTQTAQTAQTAPPEEPAAPNTAEVATQPAPVTVNYFYDTLTPYGSWVVVNGYGRCWRPTACTYNPAWQPYCDRGHWVYTDCGWYWSSGYAWGATFHYGRWFCDSSLGWCWYPGTVWAPSWVTWRYSNNYCGWAPLPPYTTCQAGVGIVYQGGGVSVGLNFGLGANCYTFVPTAYFCNPHPRNYCAPPSQVAQIINNTTIINNIRIHGSGNNQIVINNGIPVQNVVNTTHTPIRPVPVHQIDPGFAHDGSSHTPGAAHANFAGNGNSLAQPLAPTSTGPIASMPGQNPSYTGGVSGNGYTRPTHVDGATQNSLPPSANNQIRQAGTGQLNSTPVRTQPDRSRPVAAAPQRQLPPSNYRSPGYTVPVQNASANPNYYQQPAQPQRQVLPTPHNYVRTTEPRQNYIAQNQIAAPPVRYTAPPQAQPQVRSYSQPRAEVRQNYSQPVVVAAPQRSAPSVAAPVQQQPQGGGRMGNQYWGTR